MQRVLVVDDSKAMRHYIAAGLDRWFHVDISHDGQDALERCADTPFDLVVTDLEMPRVDGMGLFQGLRSSGHFIPVVLVTDQDVDRWLPMAAEVGLSHIYPKHMLHADFDGFVRMLRALALGALPVGLAPHLSPGGEVRTFIVGSSEEVAELHKETDPILSHFPRVAIYRAVLGLLVQHGLTYGTPEGGMGPGRYLHVSVGADGSRVGMAVRESSGHLTTLDVLKWLAQPQTEGSRGWGLQVVRRFMDQCHLGLWPGVSTEVVCLDLLDGYEGPRLLSITER